MQNSEHRRTQNVCLDILVLCGPAPGEKTGGDDFSPVASYVHTPQHRMASAAAACLEEAAADLTLFKPRRVLPGILKLCDLELKNLEVIMNFHVLHVVWPVYLLHKSLKETWFRIGHA